MGFVQDIDTSPPPVMRTKRELTITAYPHGGTYYFVIREIADVLSVKQPFSFTSNIRKALGAGAILKGDDTAEFRGDKNSPMVPFIAVDDIIRFLDMESTRAKYEKSLLYNRMLEEFREYEAYAKNHVMT